MTVLNGKSYTLPGGMIFQKYYCAKCGTKLVKERTHRVVTKDDKDYYQYHDRGTFPRQDYDVYDYRFMCPGCGARISYDEQRIIQRIQKKQGYTILSASEIKSHYQQSKEYNRKRILVSNILCSLAILLIVFGIFCIFGPDKSTKDITSAAIFTLILAAVAVVGAIKKHNGTYRTKFKYAHPYDKEAQLKKLHTYSSHNRNLIMLANRCYCFHCKTALDRHEIKEYADDGQTAICPKCGIDAIIPDSIEDSIDEKTISEMQEYWF